MEDGMSPTRRTFLTTLGALIAAYPLGVVPAVATDKPIVLTWDDLIPDAIMAELNKMFDEIGVLEHGEAFPFEDHPHLKEVTTEFNGKTVRLPGFVVPLDYSGRGVTALLLVPYVGACIHVPPPPPNQLVYVTTDKPYEFDGLFAAVWVTGVLSTTLAETELAEAGYTISDGHIEPYVWD